MSEKKRITTYLDNDILDELKKRTDGKGYQTLMNELLRTTLFHPKAKSFVEDLSRPPAPSSMIMTRGRGRQRARQRADAIS